MNNFKEEKRILEESRKTLNQLQNNFTIENIEFYCPNCLHKASNLLRDKEFNFLDYCHNCDQEIEYTALIDKKGDLRAVKPLSEATEWVNSQR